MQLVIEEKFIESSGAYRGNSSSSYTNQAKTLGSKNRVELWDKKDLVKNLLIIKSQGDVSIRNAEQHPPGAAKDDSSDKCFTCGGPVSPKVRQYCLAHQERFAGKIYCFEHQRVGRETSKKKLA